MLKDVLSNLAFSQQQWLTNNENEIPREQLRFLKDFHPFAYFLTGIRRSGKSTLLKQIMNGVPNPHYFNFEDSRISGFELNDFHVLESIFTAENPSKPHLFFDEIQNIPSWERYVRDAVDRKITLIITGTNANLLSKETGTKLTGRHLDFEVFPFSYKEYLIFTKQEANADSFMTFLMMGGFPGFLQTNQKEMLSTLLSDILIRDVFSRYQLRNVEIYKKLVHFLISNTGKEITFNSLKNAFEMGSATSVMDFLNYLADVYLLFFVPRFHHSLKVQVRNPRKVYAIDQGLVNFNTLSSSPDHGRLLENTIFLHIRRNTKEIWYFKEKNECDFIFRYPGKNYQTWQVSWVVGQHNEKREIDGLIEAMDYMGIKNGMIITFNQEDQIKKDSYNIHLVPAWKWLSE